MTTRSSPSSSSPPSGGSDARRGPSGRNKRDPDALATLEEERDFLLRSIEDLDRELEAGDVDANDHRALRSDYVARAAAILKAIDERQTLLAKTRRPRSIWRSVGLAAAVAVVAGLAGWAVANSSGDRSAGQQASGGVTESVGQQLATCFVMIRSAEPVDTLKCYDRILDEHPANVEARTYRGWALVLSGLPEFAWRDLTEAVALDPGYSDARVFRAITLNQLCRPDEALEELAVFDETNPPEDMLAIVESQGLRQSILDLIAIRDQVPEVAGPPEPATLDNPDELEQCVLLVQAGVFGEPQAE